MSSEEFIEVTKSSGEERRIVLVGKTGVGKSASGNTILGRREFECKLSASSQTSECQKAKGEVDGQKVAVIDIPGLFNTKLTPEEALKRVKMCISLSAPGPHVFIVVIQLGRFTEEEKETVRMIQTTFGEESAKYTMVLFTHGDKLEDQTIEQFVSTSKELQEIIRKCSGRYHVFNNRVKDPSQVIRLFDKIDSMAMACGGRYYTNETFTRAEKAIEQKKVRLLKQAEEQTQRELYGLRDKYEGELLQRETERLYRRHEYDARAQAERENDFIRHAVLDTVSVVIGATGTVQRVAPSLGATVGTVGAVAVGATVGAVAVGAVGAVAGAAVGGAVAGAVLGGNRLARECPLQ